MWRGYILIELSGALGDGLDDDQETQTQAAFQALVSYDGDEAHRQMQYRANLAKTAVIIEGEFDAAPTKKQVVDALNQELEASQTAINAAVTMTVFGGADADYAQSLDAVRAYLAAHNDEWNPPL